MACKTPSEVWDELRRRRFANARYICGPRMNGRQAPGDLVLLLRDALPSFSRELLPHITPGSVWFVQDMSDHELLQMLVPRAELLSFLQRREIAPITINTRKTLTEVRLEARQIFWVAIVRADAPLCAKIASGRINLDAMPASG